MRPIKLTRAADVSWFEVGLALTAFEKELSYEPDITGTGEEIKKFDTCVGADIFKVTIVYQGKQTKIHVSKVITFDEIFDKCDKEERSQDGME